MSFKKPPLWKSVSWILMSCLALGFLPLPGESWNFGGIQASFAQFGIRKPRQAYKEGELIIKYKDKIASTASVHAMVMNRIGATLIRHLNGSSAFSQIRLPQGMSVQSAISELQNDPNVAYVQPNYIYHITSTTPNDPDFGSLWGQKNTGQTINQFSSADAPDSTHNPPSGSSSGHDMDLTDAWDYITDCSSVTVAVVDTGVKYDHEDLSANMWSSGDSGIPNPGWNIISNSNDPMDDNGHGTHVAGTIGAVGNNGIGVDGVCWKVQLMAVKVLDSTGTGYTSDIASGINWAVSHGAKVINLSIGGSTYDATLATAISNAKSSGTVVVAAAGNAGTDNDSTPTYPCNDGGANLICVAALDQAYQLASFSNYGATTVDVGAPGVNIVSTWPFTVTATSDDFSGWTRSPSSGGWGLATPSGYGASLVEPSNWSGWSSSTYANNANDDAYKVFDLSGIAQASVAFDVQYQTEQNHDSFSLYAANSSGDPVGSGTLLDQESGDTQGYYYIEQDPLAPSCLTSTCSIGVNFTSDSSGQGAGVVFFGFQMKTSVYGTSNYNVLEGTSMATPQVTGLAAMLFAYNPDFTYADVVNAIKSGGTSLSALNGKTKTGKAVNAMGALSYIQAPTGISVVKQ